MAITFCYQSLIPFDKIYSSIAIITGYITKYLHKQNKVLQDRQKHLVHEEFSGAYVFANDGYHENLISFDVESLYPTIIRMFNISPETLITDEQQAESLSWTKHYISTPLKNIGYNSEKQGIIPQILDNIFAERIKFKKLMKQSAKDNDNEKEEYYNVQQYTRKILLNSFYGVLGNRFFSMYNIDNAKSVTGIGQEIIKFLSLKTNDYFKNYFYKNPKFFKEVNENNKIKNDVVKLIDTDSNYISLKEIQSKLAPEKDFLSFAQEFENDFFKGFFVRILQLYASKYNCKPLIKFSREKIISKMIILAKKKYITQVLDKEGVVYDKPKIMITGVEVVRTSTPVFCRNKIMDLINNIFDKYNKNENVKLLKQVKKAFITENVSNIAFPRGVNDYKKYYPSDNYSELPIIKKGTPIHVRASINYNYIIKKYKLNLQPITNGTKVKFCYVKSNNILHTNIIAFIGNYPKVFNSIFKIDYEIQWYKSLQSVIERFYIVMNWGPVNLKNDKLQSFF